MLLPLAIGMALCLASSPSAAELSLKTIEKAPPEEVGEAIGATLGKKAIQLLDGEEPVFEFWFRTSIPVDSKPASPAKGLKVVSPTALLGVVAIHRNQRDYRDCEIHAGVYTMRLGMQPQDGNHLGTADYSTFAILLPAKDDTEVDGLDGHDDLVGASAEESATGHPMILSLRPSSCGEGDAPRLTEPASDHKAICLNLSAKLADNDEPIRISLELVYEGAGQL